jgi:hypothetical protein
VALFVSNPPFTYSHQDRLDVLRMRDLSNLQLDELVPSAV